MKSLSTSLVSVALFVAAASAQFQINTPNPPTQCVPVQLTWTGGSPPFFLAIAPGGQPGATAFQQYPGLTGTSFTWPTNITAGTSIGFTLTDSTGAVAQSAPVNIQSGPDSSCLTGGASSAAGGSSTDTGAAGSSTSATAPAGSTTGAATTSASTGAASTGGSQTSSGSKSASGTVSTTPSASATGGNNGALGNAASVGVVGVLSALAAVLLA